MKKFPRTKVKADYIRLYGGLDLESPALQLHPGALISASNYICSTEGGYERIDGYERYDGRASPSDATYYNCPCSFTDSGPSVGDTVTGVDSTETAVVITVGSDYINVTKLSADFNDDEVYTVGGNPKGTFNAAQAEKEESTSLLHSTALNAAADVYRADIVAPTGSGGISGIIILDGTVYCFRDNAGDTAGLIYKATAAGWSAITLGNEISFNTGAGTVSEGDTITGAISGATAVVARVVLESGAWEANAAGRLIIGTVTGGPFQAEDLTVSGVECAATGAESAITISPGGRYEFVVYNFTGSTSTKRIYGCDGVNRGFEFDGTTYVPIDTGMTTDTPEYVAAYKYQLFFSFKGSSQNSGPGTPYIWTAVLGASEIALGDDITGYSASAKSLIILSRNSSHQLLGSTVSDFKLEVISDEAGGIPRTIQEIGKSFCLDDRGIVEISRVQEYGNFNLATISQRIQTRIAEFRSTAIASSVYREKNQYRLYSTDGTGISMTISQGRYGLLFSFIPFFYPINVSCAESREDSTGKDVVFIGSDAGMVYQCNKGSSFDGEDIEAFLALPFNNSKSPSTLKTYRRAIIEMTGIGYSSLKFSSIFSYGDISIDQHITENIGIQGTSGLWNFENWDSFFWDTEVVDSSSFTLTGDGTNISLLIYSKTDINLGHKIDSVIIHYTPRRLVR